jgi:hypothetical protein
VSISAERRPFQARAASNRREPGRATQHGLSVDPECGMALSLSPPPLEFVCAGVTQHSEKSAPDASEPPGRDTGTAVIHQSIGCALSSMEVQAEPNRSFRDPTFLVASNS